VVSQPVVNPRAAYTIEADPEKDKSFNAGRKEHLKNRQFIDTLKHLEIEDRPL